MADLSFLKKFTKGDEAKMKKYISMYLKIAPQTFARMDASVKEQNWADLAINAHALKPQAEYMGLQALKGVLVEIENRAKKSEVSDLPRLLNEAHRLHREGASFLTKIIKN